MINFDQRNAAATGDIQIFQILQLLVNVLQRDLPIMNSELLSNLKTNISTFCKTFLFQLRRKTLSAAGESCEQDKTLIRRGQNGILWVKHQQNILLSIGVYPEYLSMRYITICFQIDEKLEKFSYQMSHFCVNIWLLRCKIKQEHLTNKYVHRDLVLQLNRLGNLKNKCYAMRF